MNSTINAQTIISTGTVLSKQFIMGHVSSGAYHYVLGRIVPQFTAFLKPGTTSLPIWQVAANLQMGAQGILDKMMGEFGQDLIIRSGFQKMIGPELQSVGQNLLNTLGQNVFDIARIDPTKIISNATSDIESITQDLINKAGVDPTVIQSLIRGFRSGPGANLMQSLGQSFDIQVKGYESNMYNVAKTVQSLAGKASGMELVYGDTSFMRINYDKKSMMNSVLNNTIPKVTTHDLLQNVIESGLTSIRGL